MSEEAFYSELDKYLNHFEGCGNQLGVFPLEIKNDEAAAKNLLMKGPAGRAN